MNFYGQAKQDEILWHALFEHDPPGYFVDVGAHDGRTFSNTLALEESGWRGLCIEAHPNCIERLRQNRPGSAVIHAAAGPQNLPSVTLYATPFAFLSTVDEADVAMLDAIHGYSGDGRQEFHVPMRRMDDMLHEVKAPFNMEFICIDTEGYEVEVLKGLTLNYWNPRVLLLEGFDATHKERVMVYMAGRRYRLARTIGVDLVYCLEKADLERLTK